MAAQLHVVVFLLHTFAAAASYLRDSGGAVGRATSLVCSPGQEPADNGTACADCRLGWVSPGGTSACTPCPPGSRYDDSHTGCVLCAPGTYSYKEGWAGIHGNYTCSFAPNATCACSICVGGTEAPEAGSLSCTICGDGLQRSRLPPPGERFPPPTCSPCPPGLYVISPFSNGCTPCSDGTDAATIGGCGCAVDEFPVMPTSEDGSAPPLQCVPCPQEGRCTGVIGKLCRPGYTGWFCGYCAPGFFTLNGKCVECGQPPYPLYVLMCLAVVGFGTMLAKSELLERLQSLLQRVRLLFYHLQKLLLTIRLRVPWPAAFVAFVNIPRALNLGVEVAGPECSLGQFTYEGRYVLTMVLPLVLLLAADVLRLCKADPTRFARRARGLITLGLFAFGVVIERCFEALDCRQRDQGGTFVLAADSRVTCWDATGIHSSWAGLLAGSVVIIALLCATLPVWCCCVRRWHRGGQLAQYADPCAATPAVVAPLLASYRSDSWVAASFEAWMQLQRVLMAGLLLADNAGKQPLLVPALFLAIGTVHAGLLLAVRPFRVAQGRVSVPRWVACCRARGAGKKATLSAGVGASAGDAGSCGWLIADVLNRQEACNALLSLITQAAGLALQTQSGSEGEEADAGARQALGVFLVAINVASGALIIPQEVPRGAGVAAMPAVAGAEATPAAAGVGQGEAGPAAADALPHGAHATLAAGAADCAAGAADSAAGDPSSFEHRNPLAAQSSRSAAPGPGA